MNSHTTALIKLLTIIALTACLSGPAFAIETTEKHQNKRDGDPEKEVSVIVSLYNKPDLTRFQNEPRQRGRKKIVKALKKNSQISRHRLETFLKRKGVTKIESLWMTNSIAVTASEDIIDQIEQHPDVMQVRPNSTVTFQQEAYAYAGQAEWNLGKINAPQLWDMNITGQNIVVANMDTGVDVKHSDLKTRYRGGNNSWFDPRGQYPQPFDPFGHGTSTMGIMVGGDARGSAIGVAPGAKWIAAKLFNDSGTALYSDMHKCFQWFLDPDNDPNTDDAPHVINNSWEIRNHVNECIDEFYEDIEILRAAQIAVVFAAGNSGPNPSTGSSPANYDNTLSVGSVNYINTVGISSSRGPSSCYVGIFPQLVAPGEDIISADITLGGIFPESYTYVSGTSFAAPHVSGAMALLLSAFPDLTVSQLETILIASAVDLGTPGDDYDYGHGLLNVYAAYKFADSLCTADLDNDFHVNIDDLLIMADRWLDTGCDNTKDCKCDLNKDGQVDMRDFRDFAVQYLRGTCP